VLHDPRRVGIDATAVVMRKFLAKHAALTTETLSCLDRLLFKGHLPLGYPHAKEDFLCNGCALAMRRVCSTTARRPTDVLLQMKTAARNQAPRSQIADMKALFRAG
jgi:hypothetical protein